MADGRRVPIELLTPGDVVRSLTVPGLRTDVPFRAQYEWLSTWGLAGATERGARINEVRLGEHDGFCLINGRIKATFEHPFLIRRDDAWGFCSAELLRVGDVFITHCENGTESALAEEPIVSIEQVPGRVRTVALHIPGTNTYLADGVWTHNDASSQTVATQGSQSVTASQSGSGSSSGGSKSSGSSFDSSSESGTIVFTNQSSSSNELSVPSSSQSGGSGSFGQSGIGAGKG